MKLITFCSPSHFPLMQRFFLPSYFDHPDDIESLEVIQMIQCYPIPQFGTEQYWHHSRRQAIATYESLAQSKPGGWVLFSDCDVQWFCPLTRVVHQHPELDLMAQRDVPDILCGGFMRFRVSPASIAFCKAVVDRMQSPYAGHATKIMNDLIRENGITYGLFDPDQVWCVGNVWHSGDPMPTVPQTIAVHHASWVLDLNSKLELMGLVRQQVLSA